MGKNNHSNHEHDVPQAICSTCGRTIKVYSPYDMPIVDHETGFMMCNQCIRQAYEIIIKEDKRSSRQENKNLAKSLDSQLQRLRPHLIKEYLDKYIVEQDRPKKILSVAIYNHYKRTKHGLETNHSIENEIEKSNVLLLGPSGSGKTAILRHLANLLDVPFAVTDASSLTEAGFVGSDVEVAVRNLYYAADGNRERAENGIIYLDEFDKLARKSGENNSITADPGHEGVQQALLKMIEGNVVEFTEQGMRKHPEAPTMKMNTQNVLFLLGGAFVGIEQIIAKRLKKSETLLGFGAKIESKDSSLDDKEKAKRYDELLRQVSPEDLIKYGIIPEIVGRVPILCPFETLDEDALLRILTEPVNSPVKQYKTLLAMDNVELEFEEDALRAIAKKAIERKTGARSLKGIIEDIMLDVMFDIPKHDMPRRVVITKACVENHEAPDIVLL